MTVSLQQLQTFRAVVRNQSFSLAAKELFTSQPHVSNQIRSLEQHYRVALFSRSKGKIDLTEAGAALYAKVNVIVEELQDAERIVGDFRGLRRGSIRIAATSSFGNHLLPGVIADFQQQRPDITVLAQVANTDRVWEMLDNDEAELAITTEQPPKTRRLTAEPFVADGLVLVAPVGWELPDPVTPEVFAELPLVLREEGSLTLTVLRRLLGDHEPTVAAQLTGTAAVNEAVAAGVGISLVPESSVDAWQRAATIAVHRWADLELHHDYVLVHASSRFQSAATSALLTHLRAWADERRRRGPFDS
ncbi:LysR family transcriptional regulator [Microlunatus soli]|uniref:DNA-binding transcriptional regulator, LysR family n=1 Tax=Microlunatus soli TaxID=630515 RepID=A0A1H1ZES9_9ACTN|nr:LysR family transcriptional regulator [Microlunatus soli]SDT32218.1 DNA-binding transcriptional regulator, LysR family [Microlunatus soli]